ncbi:hypothetical protein PoB_004715200 [Plakobranchus ocellatus]|uniref:Uncharacterized protein n=1 Tax=Plakobranchus ocellatus TaxID=259542 RepID=A0AAV4BMS4_9GAST|nr:hypothetical protein PoB_004715200 [Plakobranchus ocellatus]
MPIYISWVSVKKAYPGSIPQHLYPAIFIMLPCRVSWQYPSTSVSSYLYHVTLRRVLAVSLSIRIQLSLSCYPAAYPGSIPQRLYPVIFIMLPCGVSVKRAYPGSIPQHLYPAIFIILPCDVSWQYPSASVASYLYVILHMRRILAVSLSISIQPSLSYPACLSVIQNVRQVFERLKVCTFADNKSTNYKTCTLPSFALCSKAYLSYIGSFTYILGGVNYTLSKKIISVGR